MTSPPEVFEGSGAPENLIRVRRQAPAEELLISNEGSGMSSGLGSGLGSGIILGESGSGIDGMDLAKLEDDEMSVVESKSGLLQAENVLPVTGI